MDRVVKSAEEPVSHPHGELHLLVGEYGPVVERRLYLFEVFGVFRCVKAEDYPLFLPV